MRYPGLSKVTYSNSDTCTVVIMAKLYQIENTVDPLFLFI